MMNSYIIPNWPAPKNIKAFSTTRVGGFSSAPYKSFNFGEHVGDLFENLDLNQDKLISDLNLNQKPKWIHQVHGTDIINLADWQTDVLADGCFTVTPNEPCAVTTADCLPILLCDNAGEQVMALHGGWRGLVAEIIAKGISLFDCSTKEILVWLGPAISGKVYEVGDEVRQQFLDLHPGFIDAFTPSPQGRWLMDVYGVARFQLQQLGVTQIYGGDHCTYTEKDKFFSYRRDGQTGRMVSLIYIDGF